MTSSPALDSDGLEVRTAERSDVSAVQAIERQSFPDPWPAGTFDRFLGQPSFLVAEDDDEGVVGFVVGDIIASHGRPVGHIKNLAVAPERRDEGIGTALLARTLMVLAGGNVGSVKLEVRANNEPARALYSEFGFEPVHSIPDYYPDGDDAVVLVSELRG